MNISKMNKRITLKVYTEEKSNEGVWTKLWVDIGSVWAYIKPMSGTQVFATYATEYKNTIKVNIRYNKQVKEGMRVCIDNVDYNITYVEDVDYAHVEMWLTLEKVI